MSSEDTLPLGLADAYVLDSKTGIFSQAFVRFSTIFTVHVIFYLAPNPFFGGRVLIVVIILLFLFIP